MRTVSKYTHTKRLTQLFVFSMFRGGKSPYVTYPGSAPRERERERERERDREYY